MKKIKNGGHKLALTVNRKNHKKVNTAICKENSETGHPWFTSTCFFFFSIADQRFNSNYLIIINANEILITSTINTN